MTTLSDPSVYRYIDLVKQQHRRTTHMDSEQRAAQLGYSSIDNDFVPVFDAQAQLRMWVGKQPDNTFGVTYANGDPPPAVDDAGVTVAPREGAALIGWNGIFENGAAKPGDFARVDIHISEIANYEKTGSTVVGYLLGESATLIPIDSETHYVSLVVVTNADVPSPPSAEFAVLPEPISQLAIGSVGANQLAANIILASDIYVGNPDASHLLLSDEVGLTGYDDMLNELLRFDVNQGSFKAVGEISSSAKSGKRIILNPIDSGSSLPEIRFYPADTLNFSFMNAPSVVEDVAGIGLNTGSLGTFQYTLWLSGAGYAMLGRTVSGGLKDGPFVNIDSSGVQLGYDLRSESVQRGAIRLDDLGEVSFDGFVQKAGGYYAPYPAMIFDFIDWDGGSVTFGFDRTIPGSFQSVAGNFLVWNVNYNPNVSHQFYNPHNTGVSAGTSVAGVNGRYSLIVYRTKS